MTPEEKEAYNKKYRSDGYGASADRRYRERWREKILKKDRLRKRAKRKSNGNGQAR